MKSSATALTHALASTRNMRAVRVVEEAEVPVEVLASAIVTIADGMKKLRGGRINDRALFLLIQDACPQSIGLDKIRMVLDAIGDLREKYVRPRSPPDARHT